MYEQYKQAYAAIDCAIKKYFDLRSFKIKKTYANNIVVQGKVNNTFIYVRYEIDKYGITVNFSNVVIDECMRRKGMFTGLVKVVASCKCVNAIKIGSVETREMENWCLKHKLEKHDYDYIKVIR